MNIELPLEVQARLASLSHEIQQLDICELRKLFMQLAQQNAKQTLVYSELLTHATKRERNCYRQLDQIEKLCDEYKAILSELQ